MDVRVPDLIGGDADVRESYDDATGRFRIQVRVTNRRFGPLFGYEGSFTAEYVDVAARGARPGLRPVREEDTGVSKETKREAAGRSAARPSPSRASPRPRPARSPPPPGVNQALVFYHFGSVDELLAAACRHGAEQRVSRYRERLGRIGTLAELLELAREMHAEEREGGHVGVLGQLLAGAQTSRASRPRRPRAWSCGSPRSRRYWAGCSRLLRSGEFVDPVGLAKAVAASFVGLELYEGVDPGGAERALAALEQLTALAAAFDELGPVAQRAVRHKLRRSTRR